MMNALNLDLTSLSALLDTIVERLLVVESSLSNLNIYLNNQSPTEFKRGQIVMVSDNGSEWNPVIFTNDLLVSKNSALSDEFNLGYKFCRLPTQQELTGEL